MTRRCTPRKRWPAPGTLVSVGTHRLHLHCMGQGAPAMVLESGMSGWSQDWAWVQARLAQGGQVCSYDRAGYGWSDSAPTARDGLAAVDDLRRALDAAGVATPRLLVGHSLGGLLVGMYARAYPREVAGLAFLDAVGRDYEAQFPPGRYRTFRSKLDRLLALADTLAPLHLPQLLKQPSSNIAARLPAEQRDSAVALSFSARQYHSLRMENASFDAVLRQALALGPLPAVPTLVLSSEQMRDFPPGLEDEVMRQAWQRNQHSIAQEAGVLPTVLAGSGHYLHIDQPEAVVQALDGWREQVRSRPAPR